MRFLFVVHKNEEKAEQNSVLFHRLTLKERGLRPNGYFPLMRQPLFSFFVIMFIQDVKTALYGMKYAPEIYGGRYGLGSKDVTPGMVHSVFDNLYHKHPVD